MTPGTHTHRMRRPQQSHRAARATSHMRRKAVRATKPHASRAARPFNYTGKALPLRAPPYATHNVTVFFVCSP